MVEGDQKHGLVVEDSTSYSRLLMSPLYPPHLMVDTYSAKEKFKAGGFTDGEKNEGGKGVIKGKQKELHE